MTGTAHPRESYALGRRYGSRVVVEDIGTRDDVHYQVRVRCDCGQVDVVSLGNLLSGRADRCRPCGARRRVRGEPKRPMLVAPCSAELVAAVDDWAAGVGVSRAEAVRKLLLSHPHL